MASITFEGPSVGATGKRETTTVTIEDAAFLAVVEAVCALEGYAGDDPGGFVIQRAIDSWKNDVAVYQLRRVAIHTAAGIDQRLTEVSDSIKITRTS